MGKLSFLPVSRGQGEVRGAMTPRTKDNKNATVPEEAEEAVAAIRGARGGCRPGWGCSARYGGAFVVPFSRRVVTTYLRLAFGLRMRALAYPYRCGTAPDLHRTSPVTKGTL